MGRTILKNPFEAIELEVVIANRHTELMVPIYVLEHWMEAANCPEAAE